jgi:RNA polymerase primary sigma factor
LKFSDKSSYSQYCKDISRYPLLTREQEIEVGKRIQKGDKKAVEELTLANLRLVVHIVRTYETHAPLMDLISEGNVAIFAAAKKFNPKFGAKFSSFAAHYIKRYVQRFIGETAGSYRVPVHAIEKRYKIVQFIEQYVARHHEEPSDKEISEALKIPLRNVSLYRYSTKETFSLQDEFKENEGSFDEIVPDDNLDHPSRRVIFNEESAFLKEALKMLDDRSRGILEFRFGLNSRIHTLEEVAAMYGITRERIRQIENFAIKQLRIAAQKFIDGKHVKLKQVKAIRKQQKFNKLLSELWSARN